MPLTKFFDVGLVHGPSLDGIVSAGDHGQVGRSHWHLATVRVWPRHAHIGELEAGERVVLVYLLGHAFQDGDIPVIPKPLQDGGCGFRGVVKIDLFGANNTPSTFGFSPPHDGHHRHVAVSHFGSVGGLIEAVLSGDRSDLYRCILGIGS